MKCQSGAPELSGPLQAPGWFSFCVEAPLCGLVSLPLIKCSNKRHRPSPQTPPSHPLTVKKRPTSESRHGRLWLRRQAPAAGKEELKELIDAKYYERVDPSPIINKKGKTILKSAFTLMLLAGGSGSVWEEMLQQHDLHALHENPHQA